MMTERTFRNRMGWANRVAEIAAYIALALFVVMVLATTGCAIDRTTAGPGGSMEGSTDLVCPAGYCQRGPEGGYFRKIEYRHG